MDNYNIKVSLAQTLLKEHKTHTCGTIRKHRGEPLAIRMASEATLKKGERLMRHNREVMLVAWRDKRIVRILSTLHRDEMRTVPVREKDKEELQMKQKPVAIVEYNHGMNAVDKLDQKSPA